MFSLINPCAGPEAVYLPANFITQSPKNRCHANNLVHLAVFIKAFHFNRWPMSEVSQIRLVRPVKSGWFGIFWEGYDKSLDRKVGVKIIKGDKQHIASARQHALALARLSHPNIVVVHSLSKVKVPEADEMEDAIIMEWLNGKTLEERLMEGGLSREEVFSIARAVLSGTGYMHANGMTHGDLHEGNVLVCDEYTKIIDIDVSNADTMARFSTRTNDSRRIADVSFVAKIVRLCTQRSMTDFSRFHCVLSPLGSVQSIAEISAIVDDLEQKTNGLETDALNESTLDDLYDVGLDESDIEIFRMFGDEILRSDHNNAPISCSSIVEKAQLAGISYKDAQDAIEILGNGGFFENDNGKFARYAQLSLFGFDRYLKAFYPAYQSSLNAVAIAIAKEGLTRDAEIAAMKNIPLVVVKHCLEALEHDSSCTLTKPLSGLIVTDVSAKLRRKFKT